MIGASRAPRSAGASNVRPRVPSRLGLVGEALPDEARSDFETNPMGRSAAQGQSGEQEGTKRIIAPRLEGLK
jgi:hypothetical protein